MFMHDQPLTLLPLVPSNVQSDVTQAIASIYRAEWGRIVATLIRLVGDFDLAEETAQEAFIAAVNQWQSTGIPDLPRAWIIKAARYKAIDRLRSTRTRLTEKIEWYAASGLIATHEEPTYDTDEIPDDRLRLIFPCCHPALASEAQVALTLRMLGGLETDEIARAFLVLTATMAQRLVRAKRKIRDAGIPYKVPDTNEISARSPVCAVKFKHPAVAHGVCCWCPSRSPPRGFAKPSQPTTA